MSEATFWPRELQQVGEISAKVESLAAAIMHLKEEVCSFDSKRY